MEEKDFIVPEDEAKAESQALAEAKAEEVRKEVASALGLTDDDANKPVLDKAVERELSHRKNLSTAIGQKRTWRDKAKAVVTAKPPSDQNKQFDPEAFRKQTEADVKEQLTQRDLDEMSYPDDIKAEIKSWAQYKGISVRAAEKAAHITQMIEQAVKDKRIDESTVTRTRRTTAAPAQDGGKAPNFDMSTEAGRKAFDEWKASRRNT